jgi:anti-sigma B factor antagonist
VKSPYRRIEVEQIGEVTVVRFVDRKLMKEQTDDLVTELFSLAEHPQRRRLLIDFRGLEYLSSAALGKFITLGKKVNANGGRLVLSNVDPAIRELFRVTRLDHLLIIRDWDPDADPKAQMNGVWTESFNP